MIILMDNDDAALQTELGQGSRPNAPIYRKQGDIHVSSPQGTEFDEYHDHDRRRDNKRPSCPRSCSAVRHTNVPCDAYRFLSLRAPKSIE